MHKTAFNIASKIVFYANGNRYIDEWLNSQKIKNYKNRLLARFERIKNGNFGDFKPITDTLFELRFFFGNALRVYYTFKNNGIVLLLASVGWVELRCTHHSLKRKPTHLQKLSKLSLIKSGFRTSTHSTLAWSKKIKTSCRSGSCLEGRWVRM